MDKKIINIEINKKYKTLLGDNGYKEYYFNKTDNVIDINAEDVQYAIKKVVKNKAVSWDLIPGKAIKNSINLIKKQELNTVYNNIAKVFNRYLKQHVIPNEMTISRLFCLNKKVDEIDNVDNLRPIAISSTFIKMIESVIYTRLLDKINKNNM